MISTEVFMDIFSLRNQGLSIRAIAKKLGIHRETVTKHLESKAFPSYRKTYQRVSVLDSYHQDIHDFLKEDDYKATWIFQRLQNKGFSGSYETVKRYVGTIKAQKTRLAYIRFETEPGLQAQVDFGDFKIQEPE